MDLILASVIFLLLSLVVQWIRLRRKRFSVFKQNGIPGPEPNFWTGNMNDIMKKREECIAEYVRTYGNLVGFFIGAKPFLIVTDQELMKYIQVKDFSKFTDKDMILEDVGIPQPEMMLSLPASRGAEWRRQRGLVSPSFSTSRVKKLMPILKEAGDIFMEKLEEASNKEYVNIVGIISNLILDIITKTALGIDTNIQHNANNNFLASLSLFLATDTTDLLPALSLCFPEFEPLPTKLRNIKDKLKYIFGLPSVKTILTHIKGIIVHRRKNSERREDLLQGLMEEKADVKKLLLIKNEELVASYGKENDNIEERKHELNLNKRTALSDDSIVGSASMMLAGGFDTTSTALSYLAFYLAKHQQMQEKLREEIKTQVEGKDVVYEDLFKFPYMEQIISETLRLHPTTMLTVNRIVSESFVYNGVTIPKGVTVIIPSHYLQKNPDNWPDPEKFDPERFSPENKAKVNPYIYQPFGNGPRNCVGMRFAQVVLKLIVARLVRSYRIMRHVDKDIEVNYGIFRMQPREVLVKLEPITR